jgi:uncharacterized protein (DUF3820 family)
MPKDEWKIAKNRDIGRKASSGRTLPISKKAKAASIKRLCSPDTKLWFGRYNGRKIREIPRSYLQWLLDAEPGTKHWRMEAVRGFLRGYLGH